MLEKYLMANSENRMDLYKSSELNFDEMLCLYNSCDIPQASKKWPIFWNDFKRLAPSNYGDNDIIIYRGTSIETYTKYGSGYCWTTDKNLALKFSKLCCSPRYTIVFGTIDKNPLLLNAKVKHRDIIFQHINDRNEQEVFIDPLPYYYFHNFVENKENKLITNTI